MSTQEVDLVHYSSEPLEELRYISILDQPKDWKPKGLWISDENDYGWGKWAFQNEFTDIDSELAYRIKLAQDANLLWIREGWELEVFHNRFITTKDGMERWYTGHHIDWPEVACQWDGIFITPYQWHYRNGTELRWYYTWDVASGCVWNPRAIAEFTLIPEDERIRFGTKPEWD